MKTNMGTKIVDHSPPFRRSQQFDDRKIDFVFPEYIREIDDEEFNKDERYNQRRCCSFNVFDDRKIDFVLPDYIQGTDRRRDVAGTSLSGPSSLEGSGNPSTSGYLSTKIVDHSPPFRRSQQFHDRKIDFVLPEYILEMDDEEFNKDERYNQKRYCSFNMFDGRKIDFVLPEYIQGTDRRRDVAGTSLSGPSSLEGAGNPSTSGCPPGKNTHDGGAPISIGLVNNIGDPTHSPTGKGKALHEKGAGGFTNVSGDATGSMNASRERDLERGRVNDNNRDPRAPGNVPSSVVPHVAHTANRLGGDGLYVAMTAFSAVASRTATTSMFANFSNIICVVGSVFAILLADTNWRAATSILAKAGIFACAVGLLADFARDLPLPLLLVALIAAIFIIIAAMVFANEK